VTTKRVLFVDDEPQVLEGIARALRKQVDLTTAGSGAEALRQLAECGPFALVVSDMRMPGMGGVQFLAKVREIAPHTIRMVLSGQADLASTIAAVNEGHIYRFLSKPCGSAQLLAAIEDGMEQYRLRTLEKVLLEQTLSGSFKMLIEILGMVSPTASSRAIRLRDYTTGLVKALGLPPRWQWSLAAFVSQLGCVSLPAEMLAKLAADQTLTDEEAHLYLSHPKVAGRLLAGIPRLEDVAAIVTAQMEMPDLKDAPPALRDWKLRTLGLILLYASLEFDRRVTRGLGRDAAVAALQGSAPRLPQELLKALETLEAIGPEHVLRQVTVSGLCQGMMLEDDVVSLKGIRLVSSGTEVTGTLIVRLQTIAAGVGIKEPLRVRVRT